MKILKKSLTLVSAFLIVSSALASDVVEVTMVRKGKDYLFVPENITIAPGTKVVWNNTDNQLHNVVSGVVENRKGMPDGRFKSPYLKGGQKYEFVFNEKGEFPYYCLPHIAMKMTGKIIVK